MSDICGTITKTGRWLFGIVVGAGYTVWSCACMTTAASATNEAIVDNNKTLEFFNNKTIGDTDTEELTAGAIGAISVLATCCAGLCCYGLYRLCSKQEQKYHESEIRKSVLINPVSAHDYGTMFPYP